MESNNNLSKAIPYKLPVVGYVETNIRAAPETLLAFCFLKTNTGIIYRDQAPDGQLKRSALTWLSEAETAIKMRDEEIKRLKEENSCLQIADMSQVLQEAKKITEIGHILRGLRIITGERLYDQAQRLGMGSAFLSSLEWGKVSIPKDFVQKLNEAYGGLGNEIINCLQEIIKE